MGTFRMISTAELRTRKRLNNNELALFDQFKSYLTKIENNYAGIYEFAQDDDRDRCKKLLRKAAKALDMKVRLIEEGESVVFYRRRSRNSKKK